MEANKQNGSGRHLPWTTKRGRLALTILLVVVILLAGLLYSQRHQIHLLISGSHTVGGEEGVADVHLPPGFQASVFYSGLSSPRFITFSPDGTLFVAERGKGSIVALPDPHHVGKAQNKVVFIPMDANGRITGPAQDYATGWLASNDTAVGRPVGLTVGPDGALYVSDDKAGMIYRITWTQHP